MIVAFFCLAFACTCTIYAKSLEESDFQTVLSVMATLALIASVVVAAVAHGRLFL